MTHDTVRRSAVQFGAGNIGRGFIAQLFHESGLEVVFVDVVPPVLAGLRDHGAYSIHVVGAGAGQVRIDNVRGVDGRERETVAAEVAACEVACTAVGAGALRHIAPNLAAGLDLRHRQGGPPLNVLVCENLHDAADQLRALVAAHLPDEARDAILARTGFVQAVVSRMVPLQDRWPVDPADPLAIRVEAYKRLPVDARAVVGCLPPLVGVEPVPNYAALIERKLYTHNCAHATLGYLGWREGLTYGQEALAHPRVRPVLDAVMSETGEALVRRHAFDRQEHAAHVADLMARFANAELGDTCFRLGRDPLRKLAPDDRLVGAARLCEAEGVDPVALPRVIAAALRFDAPDDPSAVELQRRLSDDGIAPVLSSVCGIDAAEPLGKRVLEAWSGEG